MGFPATRHTVVQAVADADPEVRRQAWESLAVLYWPPVFAYLRFKWRASDDDAADLAQGFFARALEKGFFDGYDPRRARFRTYLRTCLDGYVANERAAARRLKRGGGARHLPLDLAAEGGPGELPDPAPEGDPEACFHREWVRSLFGLALEALRQECQAGGKLAAFAVFERYDLEVPAGERPTYASLAAELGLPATQVTNHLAAMRRSFRRHVLEVLRSCCGSDEEFRAEARELLGVDSR
jgi:DNA-directed RNA polymerase specialized sigma24 family protein